LPAGLESAIGAGIDLASGMTLTAVWRNIIVGEHPDTGSPVTGIKIPNWNTLLAVASQCCGITGLGYVGVDLVLDRGKGPLLLEINARPGLSIQIANRSGLLRRLKLVEQYRRTLGDVESRIAFSQKHFAHNFTA
jgi:hypothetical protein